MKHFLVIALLCASLMLSLACQPAANTSTTTNNTAAANAPANTTANPVEPNIPSPVDALETTSGSLATPTEAYKTAYELRKKKDVAGLKNMMSKDIQEFLTMMGEEEKKSLDDMIKEMCDKPQADKAESRNEKIKGDRAELEYLDETGKWKTMDFEKIDGKWLMSFPKADKPGDAKSDK